MIFPIGDDNSDRRATPIVTYLLIALNIFFFIFLQGMGANDDFTYAFSTVPQEIATGQDAITADRVIEDPLSGDQFRAPGLKETPGSVYLTLFTSMFMHGGWMHLLGNMLFLKIFGDNLEDAMGRGRFLIFYLLCGLIASLVHVMSTYVFNGNPLIPSLGASGAISGVLGGYLLMFPHRRVRAIIGYFVQEIPALLAIGLWFLFQVISGIGALGAGSQEGGVAYGAHIGGFIAGFILVKLFAAGYSPRAAYR